MPITHNADCLSLGEAVPSCGTYTVQYNDDGAIRVRT